METGHTPTHHRSVKRHPHPRLLLAVLATLGLSPLPAGATGDYYEEPLQTLSEYLRLDQLPAKSFEEVLKETSKPVGELPEINYAAELLALSKKPGPEALASVDKMIGVARARAEVNVLSLLNDLRDVLAGPANAAESAAYLEWRIAQADRFGVRFEKPKEGEITDEKPELNPALVADVERQLAKASPALKPHWLYLRGALEYRSGNIGDSQDWFARVAKEFPKSLRAEVALYMNARCQMWRTRSSEYTQQDRQVVESERPKAKKLFEEYMAKFPKGRHYGDALGWYAALAFDGQDFATALRYYLMQLDLADHPELHDMAAHMVERTLSHLASEPRDKAFAEVAKHPRAALALVYLIINTSESDNYNGEYDSVETVRGWRKAVLPKLAAALSAQAKLYQNAEWKPRQLAMLAFALSGAGQQEPALKLLQTAGAAESDDLLLARGVVNHRAKKTAEAASALQALLEKFPESPLAKGARLRLGLALSDNRQAGEAVLALRPLVVKPKGETPKPAADPAAQPTDSKAEPEKTEEDIESDFYPEMDGGYAILYPIDLHQVRALIDTLLNFAPIDELAATSKKDGLDPVVRLQFTEAIAQRLLAKEQFDEAKKYLTPAQWSLVAEPIEKLTQAAKAEKDPAARATACLKLGDAWAAARGKLLTFPLDTDETRRRVYIAFSSEANGRRADAAPFIGATGNYRLDLENRDELRHAFNWWLEASDAQPGTPQTAQALWRALKAMPEIADVSPYTYERALTRKWGDVAKKLYDRLRTECADSVEAKRYAVAWDFPVPKKPDYAADDPTYHIIRDAAGVKLPADEIFGAETPYNDNRKTEEELLTSAKELENDARKGNPAVVQARVEKLAAQARASFTSLYGARWVNFFEDMALFFGEPDIAPEVRARYVALRVKFLDKSAIGGGGYDDKGPDAELQEEIQTALADAQTKPAADYFEFLDLAVIANHFTFVTINKKKEEDAEKDDDTYRTRDYPLLARKSQAFLAKYPKSRKREAALLLNARAVFKASEEVHLRKLLTWPQAPRWEGGYFSTVTAQEPFEAKRVRAALDAYDAAFPKGRYAADIRSYRAAVALRLREWKTALEMSVRQLTDAEREDLQGAAAERIAALFNQLADERYRADVLPIIKADPKTRELLEKYLAVESTAHPLRYMGAWLRGQLAAK